MLMPTSRPRVVAIGLNENQVGSIGRLCGTLRTADSAGEYVKEFNWTETDIVIGVGLRDEEVGDDVHVVAITPRSWTYYCGTRIVRHGGRDGMFHQRVRVSLTINTDSSNTEREVSVPKGFSGFYKDLAHDLAKHCGDPENHPRHSRCGEQWSRRRSTLWKPPQIIPSLFDAPVYTNQERTKNRGKHRKEVRSPISLC